MVVGQRSNGKSRIEYHVKTDAKTIGMAGNRSAVTALLASSLAMVLALFSNLSWGAEPAPAADPPVMWYAQPAGRWVEALPLGNGRLGAMVFGAAPKERLQLNEESLWAGERCDAYPDRYVEHLRRLQRLTLEGKIAQASQLGLKKMTQSPTSFRSYEPLCDLWIEMRHGKEFTGYRRELDMQAGIARVSYTAGDVKYRREVLISAVDDVIAVRLSASRPGAIGARVWLTRKKDMEVSAAGGNRLHMDGQIVDDDSPGPNPGGSGPGGAHMKFAGRLLARATAGSVRAEGDALLIDEADEAVLLFTAATDYNVKRMHFDRSIDPVRRAETILARVSQKSWDDILATHAREHRALFNRVSIDLGGEDRRHLPTDKRLAAVKQGAIDPQLESQYFQFGRYLLMSSSRRPGRLPANLQGLWNERMWAPWEADYHLNINLQMNYWPTDLCNLPGTIEPLLNWFIPQTERGRVSAKRLYNARGWVSFTASNVFGRSTPSGSTKGSQFVNGVLDPLAGAWMAMTLWRHWEFTRDKQFLKTKAYPVLKGAAAFILDYLVERPDGKLVIVPSTSPENRYVHPETGKSVRLTVASTYHTMIVRAVLDATWKSARLLDTDPELRREIEAARARLPGIKIGSDGTIQEWIEDYKEANPGHRHMSHLIGVHPFSLITPSDERLFEAARRTIERRMRHGGGHTGWSRAWVVNFFARLRDGERAHENLLMLLRKSTLPNLFDVCPPFQIDGNFGGTSGIAEMLLQSHVTGENGAHVLDLLPALPPAWPRGSVKGLRARGGFVVDIDWEDGELAGATIRSERGRTAPVRYKSKRVRLDTEPGGTYRLDGRIQPKWR